MAVAAPARYIAKWASWVAFAFGAVALVAVAFQYRSGEPVDWTLVKLLILLLYLGALGALGPRYLSTTAQAVLNFVGLIGAIMITVSIMG